MNIRLAVETPMAPGTFSRVTQRSKCSRTSKVLKTNYSTISILREAFCFFCFDYQPKAKIKEISPTPTVNVIERSMRDLILETHIDRPGENPRAPELRVREDPVPVFPYCLRSRGVQMEYDAPIKKNTWHYFYLRFSRNKGGSGVFLCRTEGA